MLETFPRTLQEPRGRVNASPADDPASHARCLKSVPVSAAAGRPFSRGNAASPAPGVASPRCGPDAGAVDRREERAASGGRHYRVPHAPRRRIVELRNHPAGLRSFEDGPPITSHPVRVIERTAARLAALTLKP